jgi:type IV pilus assembly protein PilW
MKSGNRLSFYQAGFTLVEIMVGLVIGMLATVVIMQVFTVFETQKRTTTGTADAQTNGSIALYHIGREMQMAGYPLIPATDSPLECTTLTFGTTGITGISPVTITDGTSDTITIRYGNSLSGGIPTSIGALSGNDATVGSNFGCQAGDITLITNGTTCAMSSASAVAGTTTVTLADTTAAIAGASLACLGTWSEISYAVTNGELTRNGIPTVAGVVNLQAQYGISNTAASNQVTAWVNATAPTWAAPSVADRNRIKAVRIAVVARNAKMESDVVTAACSSTTASPTTGLCAWTGSVASPAPAINLSADANWQRYRYRVFETIIPLRNMIWSKDTL